MRTVWVAAYVFAATNEIDAVLAYGTDRNNCIHNAIAWFQNTRNEAWSVEARLSAIKAMVNLENMVNNTTQSEFALVNTGLMVAIMEMKEVTA